MDIDETLHELLPLRNVVVGDADIKTVSGRQLHTELGIQKDFSNWIKRQITRARLLEGRDYVKTTDSYSQQGINAVGRPSLQYYLTLDAAKHVAMLSGTDRGFAIREYFINCEKRLRKMEEERLANRSHLEKARDNLAMQQEIVRLLEQDEDLRTNNVIVPRPVIVPSEEAAALRRIKREIVPYLSERAISHILNGYGQIRTIVQYGSGERAVTRPFARAGIEAAVQQFLSDAIIRVSASGKTLVLQHECLFGNEAQIDREDAIRYLGYTAEQFKTSSGMVANLSEINSQQGENPTH